VTLVLEVVFWWAAGVGMWLLTLSSISSPELVAAVAAGLPCAVMAVLARRAVGGPLAPRRAWLRWSLPVPAAIVADTVRVLALAAGVLVGRPVPEGDLRSVTLPRDPDDRAWQNRQAAAAVLVTTSPGTVVVDLDPDSGEMLVHHLGSGRPRLEDVVQR
jgi:multisubunit Na+/H+ antiporter MnhE subunit